MCIPRQRHIFALNLPIPLSTELLLVGSNELTINQNTEIFLSVQKFILSSKTSFLKSLVTTGTAVSKEMIDRNVKC
jgi:hypothetical protein